MSRRQFADRRGREWEVWEVPPDDVERRLRTAKRGPDAPERRHVEAARISVPSPLEPSWLAFERPGLRRRFAPMPPRWMQMTDEELRQLLQTARPAPTRQADRPPAD